LAGDGVTGTWDISPGSDSFVGYRVREELAQIGFTEAVGRTSELEAVLEIDGATIVDVFVEVDMSTLESDNSNRDRQMRSQALETDEFPLADFQLTAPIELGEVPADGVAISATATGELTIHGVTRTETIPLTASFDGTRILVFGELGPILLADYDIDQPRAAVVLSVEDNALLEVQLFFAQI